MSAAALSPHAIASMVPLSRMAPKLLSAYWGMLLQGVCIDSMKQLHKCHLSCVIHRASDDNPGGPDK